MEGNGVGKDCNALGGLFQQIVMDLKVDISNEEQEVKTGFCLAGQYVDDALRECDDVNMKANYNT